MEDQSPSNKNHLIAFVAIFVVAFILGALIGSQAFKGGAPATGENTYEAGWNAAKKRLADSPEFGPRVNGPTEVSSLNGKVQAIDGNKVSLAINPLEPLADPKLDVRVVTVTNDTKITRVVPRDSKEVQTEMEAFMKKMQTPLAPGQEPPTPPVTSTKEDGQLSDIKVGDTVIVTAETNIKDVKEFAITSIEIQ